jgi:hypothetical protein
MLNVNSRRTVLSKFSHTALCLLALLASLATMPAAAKGSAEGTGWDADASLKLIATENALNGSDDLDSSGIGARAELGYQAKTADTEFRLEVDASVFDFSDDARPTREGYGVRAKVTQAIGANFKLSAEGRHATNIATLESLSTDQTSARGEVSWDGGDDEVTGYAEYRWRDYDDLTNSEGHGLRTGVEYRHHFASWHWLRFDLSHEDIASANPLRGFERDSASIDYSHPIAKNLRLLAGIEARRWTYDDRIAQGAAVGVRRKDSLIAPEIGLSFGRTNGIYVNGRASYQFRQSNDVRYGNDGPRLDLTMGYRF